MRLFLPSLVERNRNIYSTLLFGEFIEFKKKSHQPGLLIWIFARKKAEKP